MFATRQTIHDSHGPTGEPFDAVPSQRQPSSWWSADVLAAVAEAGRFGGFPDDVAPEEIGWALKRLLSHSPRGDDAFASVVQGYHDAQTWIDTGRRPELAES